MANALCTFVYDAKACSNFHNEYSNWLLIIRRAFHLVSCLRLRLRLVEIRNGLIAVGNCNIRRLARTCRTVQQAVGQSGKPSPYIMEWLVDTLHWGLLATRNRRIWRACTGGRAFGIGRRVGGRDGGSFMDNSITVCIIQQWLAVIDCLFS